MNFIVVRINTIISKGYKYNNVWSGIFNFYKFKIILIPCGKFPSNF